MATEYRTETVFTWGAPPLKFGVGALDEIGFDLGQMGLSRVLIVTDEGVAATGIPRRAAESIQAAGLKPTIFSGGHVEPTDQSMRAAADFPRHREGNQPAAHHPGRPNDQLQKAGRWRQGADRAAEAADRGADDGGNWLGEHRDVHTRRAGAEGKDRHQPP